MKNGAFVISLDFEIHWGVSDHHTIETYHENLTNVPKVVRQLLQLFREKNIHTTWATVGMLLCRTKEELFAYVAPEHRPTYTDARKSNYTVAASAGNDEASDPYHFAPGLVSEIASTPGQELATHTYSHYYCLEPGQTTEQFAHDLKAAIEVGKKYGFPPESIVFPANQFHPEYMRICSNLGIKSYRGNYPAKIYQFQAKAKEGKLKRLARLIDTYIPLKGNRTVTPVMNDGILNIPASCFMRPYQKKLAMIDWLRIWRMKREMTAAARNKKVYHLWWHPHNFGSHIEKNMHLLNLVLDHFVMLRDRYGMESLTMAEIHKQTTKGV